MRVDVGSWLVAVVSVALMGKRSHYPNIDGKVVLCPQRFRFMQ